MKYTIPFIVQNTTILGRCEYQIDRGPRRLSRVSTDEDAASASRDVSCSTTCFAQLCDSIWLRNISYIRTATI